MTPLPPRSDPRRSHALGRFDDASIATALLAAYPRQDDAWRSRVRELLLSRASWARAYLAAIDRGAAAGEAR